MLSRVVVNRLQDDAASDPTTELTSQRTDWRRLSIFTFLVIIWFSVGLATYMSMGNDFVSSLYALTQIITTIGYGDMLPTTPQAKLLVSFLVLASTIVIAELVSMVIERILESENQIVQEAMRRQTDVVRIHTEGGDDDLEKRQLRRWQLFICLATFFGFIIIGTVFYGTLERCSCSYGHTYIEECEYEHCMETGGIGKTYIDSFYMAVITLSTVGFGDETAESQEGRVFAIFWMTFGVGSTVQFSSCVASYIHHNKRQFLKKKISEDLFMQMDEDGSGELDKFEFLRFQLVLNDVASSAEIEEIMAQFDMLDRSQDGTVSWEEVRKFYHYDDDKIEHL